jgi:hypothetical protein
MQCDIITLEGKATMRLSICCAALVSTLTLSATAMAQEAAPAVAAAPAVKVGALLKSSDGKRIGRIERVVTSKAGTAVSASLIVDSRFVYVPVSTISASDSGLVTSLSRADVRKLK